MRVLQIKTCGVWPKLDSEPGAFQDRTEQMKPSLPCIQLSKLEQILTTPQTPKPKESKSKEIVQKKAKINKVEIRK